MRMFMLISLVCWIACNSVDGQTTAAAEDCPYPKACFSSEPLKPVVVCGSSQITVLLRRCVLQALGHTGADLQLSDPACAPSATCYAGEPYVHFVLPHDNPCGSTLSETNTSIVFKNVVSSVEDAGESWRAIPIHLEISCSYPTGASLKLGLPSTTVPPGLTHQAKSGIVSTIQKVAGTTTKSAGQLPVPGKNGTSTPQAKSGIVPTVQKVAGTTTKSAGQLPVPGKNGTLTPQPKSGIVPTVQKVAGTTTKSAGQLPASGKYTTLAPGPNTQSVFKQTSKLASGQKATASSGKTIQTGSTGGKQTQFSGIVAKQAVLSGGLGRSNSCESMSHPRALVLLGSVLSTIAFTNLRRLSVFH